jgi:hypothetical protein
MFYARLENGIPVEYPIYEGEVRLRFPNVSFPDNFDAPEGYVKIVSTTAPENLPYHYIDNEVPVFQDGQWVQQWKQVPFSDAQKAEQLVKITVGARQRRHMMLGASDWTQGKDIPDSISTPWATYRQALRDVPAQSGFPENIQWPVPPA